jgi:hypothetical protein
VGGYHGLQHAGNANNGFATIGWWNSERVNELATKLDAIKEGTTPPGVSPPAWLGLPR